MSHSFRSTATEHSCIKGWLYRDHHCVQPSSIPRDTLNFCNLRHGNPLSKHTERVSRPTVSWTNQDTRGHGCPQGKHRTRPSFRAVEVSPSPALSDHRGSFLHRVPEHMASPYQTKTRRLLPILTEGWNSRHSSSKSGSTWWKRIIRKLKHPLLSQGLGPACRRHQGLRTSLDS